MKIKIVAILIVAIMFAGMAVAVSDNGAGDGTGPIGDGIPDRVDWICTEDPITGEVTCVPPRDGSCQD